MAKIRKPRFRYSNPMMVACERYGVRLMVAELKGRGYNVFQNDGNMPIEQPNSDPKI